MRNDVPDVGSRDQTFARGEFECQHDAQRNCLAVQQPVGIAATGLQRVAECMAEVEQRTLACFSLIARDDAGLSTTTDRNRVLTRRTARKHVLVILLKPCKERAVTKQSEFGNLGIACAKFPL